MVSTTGIGEPFSISCEAALKSLQNCMMFRPRWPSAGPMGGDGLAAPAGTCSFRYPVIFFAIHSLRCCAGPEARHLGCAWCGRFALRWHEGQTFHALRLDLLDLTVLEFDGRSPAEDGDRHLQAS